MKVHRPMLESNHDLEVMKVTNSRRLLSITLDSNKEPSKADHMENAGLFLRICFFLKCMLITGSMRQQTLINLVSTFFLAINQRAIRIVSHNP